MRHDDIDEDMDWWKGINENKRKILKEIRMKCTTNKEDE